MMFILLYGISPFLCSFSIFLWGKGKKFRWISTATWILSIILICSTGSLWTSHGLNKCFYILIEIIIIHALSILPIWLDGDWDGRLIRKEEKKNKKEDTGNAAGETENAENDIWYESKVSEGQSSNKCLIEKIHELYEKTLKFDDYESEKIAGHLKSIEMGLSDLDKSVKKVKKESGHIKKIRNTYVPEIISIAGFYIQMKGEKIPETPKLLELYDAYEECLSKLVMVMNKAQTDLYDEEIEEMLEIANTFRTKIQAEFDI